LTPKDTAKLQYRFWRQVALYLCAPRGNIWIRTGEASYNLRQLLAGRTIGVQAGVEDPRGVPLPKGPGEKVTLTWPDKDGRPAGRVETVELRQAQGDGQGLQRHREGRLAGLTAEGEYLLTFTATVEGKDLRAEHRFEVVNPDLESLEVLADLSRLRQMAVQGQGRYVPLSKIGELLKGLKLRARPRPREDVRRTDLGRDWRWPLVAALIVLLCIEWSLRKRKGLV
jgi:hypothetical protein